jgi:hypothetical protein
MGITEKKKKPVVIDEKTPLMILAGPMFLELFLNVMVNKKKWIGKSVVEKQKKNVLADAD